MYICTDVFIAHRLESFLFLFAPQVCGYAYVLLMKYNCFVRSAMKLFKMTGATFVLIWLHRFPQLKRVVLIYHVVHTRY